MFNQGVGGAFHRPCPPEAAQHAAREGRLARTEIPGEGHHHAPAPAPRRAARPRAASRRRRGGRGKAGASALARGWRRLASRTESLSAKRRASNDARHGCRPWRDSRYPLRPASRRAPLSSPFRGRTWLVALRSGKKPPERDTSRHAGATARPGRRSRLGGARAGHRRLGTRARLRRRWASPGPTSPTRRRACCAWLDDGRHGEMAVHGTARRAPLASRRSSCPGTLRVITRPHRLLAGRRTRRAATCSRDRSRAYVSRYALGRDYHKVVAHAAAARSPTASPTRSARSAIASSRTARP